MPSHTRDQDNSRSILTFLPTLIRGLGAVSEVELLRLAVPSSIESRLGEDAVLTRAAALGRIEKTKGESFTEKFLGHAFDSGRIDRALIASQFHVPLSSASGRYRFHPRDVSFESLSAAVGQISANEMLVITSRVVTPSGMGHIPMLDLKLPASDENHPYAMAIGRRLGLGAIFISGSSYHFYGSRLLYGDELRQWLYFAQLLGPAIDFRWTTHQLIEERCALRISAGPPDGQPPQLLDLVGG